MNKLSKARLVVVAWAVLLVSQLLHLQVRADDWLQYQGDALRSGNAVHIRLPEKIGLMGYVPMSDALFAAPVMADGAIYVVDGSGAVAAIDASSLKKKWQTPTRGSVANCNNTATPVVIGNYLPRQHHGWRPLCA